MARLKTGEIIKLKNGKTCQVVKLLGEGGQGWVYLVRSDGKEYALKWYKDKLRDEFYNNLQTNVKLGPWASNYIWPLAVTERHNGTFGYLMRLIPKEYKSMSEFMMGYVKLNDPALILKACLQITEAFQRLHINGYSYQDINDGGFHINPSTGDVLICDNDNVAPWGKNLGVEGKSQYIAPEVVEGLNMPNTYTDYFSMAICLFILIYMHRPFDGAWSLSCPADNDPKMAKRLFGRGAVFCMDPDNAKNRPTEIHRNIKARWSLFPKLLSDAFIKTFCHDSIINPNHRLMDRQWTNILLQARALWTRCPHCGNTVFVDPSPGANPCPYCKKQPKAAVLKAGKFTIPLVEGQQIHACLVDNNSDINHVYGHVERRNGELGIVNDSDTLWTAIAPSGSSRAISKGHGVPVAKGVKIRFGHGEYCEVIDN